ncbi:hypothetical protein QUB33_06650 [Microcoleus sp. B3-A4]|uniref:hypothetical protein n=1 Tax=Microcoleus sp. B3-A4 TaxID=2818653 RepID=UPI002FD3DC99
MPIASLSQDETPLLKARESNKNQKYSEFRENKYYGETKGMTRDEAARRIDQAAEKKLTELDLSGLELEELPPEIAKCTHLISCPGAYP